MAPIEKINKKVSKLPPDKQATILDFISFQDANDDFD
jgi:hypothetical protein